VSKLFPLKKRLLIGWAYVVEILATVLLYALIRYLFSETELRAFVLATSGTWATVFGIAAAVAAALWTMFFQVLSTEFGAELRSRGAASAISTALAAPIVFFLCATTLFMLVPIVDRPSLTHGAVLVGIYSIINVATLIRNVNWLVRLYQDSGK
jgi:hypothetical protein